MGLYCWLLMPQQYIRRTTRIKQENDQSTTAHSLSVSALVLSKGMWLSSPVVSSIFFLTMPAHNLPKRLLDLDAKELSDCLASGEATAVQLMKTTLDAIDEVNPTVNALISIRDREELLKEAAIADSSPRKGWLHGIPTAVKDMANAEGIATTMGGSPLFRKNNIAAESDIFVQNIVDAGAIIIGKTNTPEHGLGSHTFNTQWGTTLNPFNTTLSAGGSSGGAAVALSTRMLAIVDGSDMMGSLRIPAGWNNIYSIRPTAGMIEPSQPNAFLPHPISTAGPMARTPTDLCLLLETMAGTDRFNASLFSTMRSAENIRIGWLADWGGALPIEEGIIPLCADALNVFTKNGADGSVDLISKPPFDSELLWKSWTTIRSKLLADQFLHDYGESKVFNAEPPLKSEILWEIERGLILNDTTIEEAQEIAKRWSSCVTNLFEKYDILALPSSQVWPFPAEWRWPETIAGTNMDTYHRWMQVVVPGSLAGLPCATIPVGFNENGLPMGMYLMGPRNSDAKLLALAEHYHSKIDWPSKRKPSNDRMNRGQPNNV